jgi:CRP-like cAMP-binding protein
MKILRIRNTTLADLLPGAVWDELCAIGAQSAYSDSQLIEECGDAKDGISLVVSGEIAVGNIRRDGSFLVSGLLRQGECYGQFTAFLGLPLTHSLWAVGQTEVVFVSASQLVSFLGAQPVLYEALLKLALWRNVEILEFLDAQRRLSLPLRIARLLLAAPAKGPDQNLIDCRQEDLADTLGVSRVAVGKALKKLELERLISIGYGKITVIDRRQLSKRIEVGQAQN